ncbi:MAG: nuclear transport factor 2 family protein [Pseudomonadota bacterium]
MHTLLDLHREWLRQFERCVEDGQWDRLYPYLTDDVGYAVCGMPFACNIRGREAVVAGFAKSIENFDKRFDRRVWTAVGTKIYAPNGIRVRIWGHYEKEGYPVLAFPAIGYWTYRDDKIEQMTDLYEEDVVEVQEAFAWIAERPGEFDASYV